MPPDISMWRRGRHIDLVLLRGQVHDVLHHVDHAVVGRDVHVDDVGPLDFESICNYKINFANFKKMENIFLYF